MKQKQLGTPVSAMNQKEITAEFGGFVPGLGWKLDEQTERDIEAIEANARTALYRLRQYPFVLVHNILRG